MGPVCEGFYTPLSIWMFFSQEQGKPLRILSRVVTRSNGTADFINGIGVKGLEGDESESEEIIKRSLDDLLIIIC